MKVGDLYISNTSLYDFGNVSGATYVPVGSIALIVKTYDGKVDYVSLDKIFCLSERSFYIYHDQIKVG